MPDPADRAQTMIEREHEHANRLREVGPELETADNCDACGAMIPSMRQAAVPGTRYCVVCAGRFEMAHQLRGFCM